MLTRHRMPTKVLYRFGKRIFREPVQSGGPVLRSSPCGASAPRTVRCADAVRAGQGQEGAAAASPAPCPRRPWKTCGLHGRGRCHLLRETAKGYLAVDLDGPVPLDLQADQVDGGQLRGPGLAGSAIGRRVGDRRLPLATSMRGGGERGVHGETTGHEWVPAAEPDYAIPPGETLRDRLADLGIRVKC